MARDERRHNERTGSCRCVLRVARSVASSAERRVVRRVERSDERCFERRVERRVELRSDFPCETIHPDWSYRPGANLKVICCSARRPGVGDGAGRRVKRAITKKLGLPRVVGRRSRLTKPNLLSGGATTDDGATDEGQHVTQRQHNRLRATMITTDRCGCISFSWSPRALFH